MNSDEGWVRWDGVGWDEEEWGQEGERMKGNEDKTRRDKSRVEKGSKRVRRREEKWRKGKMITRDGT